MDVNNKSVQLTDEQINKITLTIIKAAEKIKTNAQIVTLAHNLKLSRDMEEKRKWIVLFFSQCFQLLQFMGMARDDKRNMEEYRTELSKLFKEIPNE